LIIFQAVEIGVQQRAGTYRVIFRFHGSSIS
jgi:hypothetical protein